MSRNQRGGVIFRLMALLVFLLLVGVVYVARYPLMRMAGNFWVVADPIQHADAILVIGDDNFTADRASRAAELFHAGWAPKVVASGRRLRPYSGIAELIERDLENRGVPSAAVVRFAHNADNTREEAEALRQFVMEQRWHRVLLVTSNYHSRRARYTFRKVFPMDVSVAVVPAKDSDFDPDAWWASRKGQKLLVLEVVSYCLSMWELRGVTGKA
jgi:uncharacterized SAM-binding protein YcdF (DUF218 family)